MSNFWISAILEFLWWSGRKIWTGFGNTWAYHRVESVQRWWAPVALGKAADGGEPRQWAIYVCTYILLHARASHSFRLKPNPGFLPNQTRNPSLTKLHEGFWDSGREQLISNGGRFKPAFAKRDKKHTMIDFRVIATNWFKNQFCPSIRLSRMWTLSRSNQ